MTRAGTSPRTRPSPPLPAAPFLVLAIALLLAACAPATLPVDQAAPPEKAYLRLDPAGFDALAGWKGDDQSAALSPLLRSCEKIRALPPRQPFGPQPEFGRVLDWLPICAAAALIRPGNETEAEYFFESRFIPYRASTGGRTTGLFTAYFEPELRGAWKPDPVHRHPIYARPRDLVSVDLGRFRSEWKGRHIAGRIEANEFVPYPSRAEINQGILKGRQLELLWVADAIDVFFLHVQGSGRVVMPDGSVVRIGYAGRNGHRYTPIGRELVARGEIPADAVSLATIRAWLKANPLSGSELMERNKSFIFFRLMEGEGPVGAQGVPLTAGRSLAVDRRHIPLGVPLWLDTTGPGKAAKPLRRLVVAQDTGSAIKGPIRGDLFAGFGTEAGLWAGEMKQPGGYHLLLPRARQP